MVDLCRLARRLTKLTALMFSAGEAGCFKTFVEARRSVLERTLTGLGTEYSSKDDYARLVWPVLEKKCVPHLQMTVAQFVLEK